MREFIEFISIVSAVILGLSAVILLVIGGTYLFDRGPNFARYWELDYQKNSIEVQLKDRCLKDKYYCNPQNYNFELKGKAE